MSDLQRRDQNNEPAAVSDDPVIGHLRQARALHRQVRERPAAGSDELAPGADSQGAVVVGSDPVISHLKQAELLYWEKLQTSQRRLEELMNAKADANSTQAERERLAQELEDMRRELQRERDRLERQHRRAAQLASSLKDIHRSLFSGDVYTLILRACLTITGATRGVYVTSRGEVSEASLRVRAAVDVNGYPQSPPSEYLQAMCKKVLEENDTVVCNEHFGPSDLPQPVRPEENFRNFIAVPVVLLKNLDGIVVAADKTSGDFEKDDIDALLSVGDQASVALENAQLQRELQNAYIATVTMLADAVEAKDPSTRGHCDLVSRYARLIASRMELPETECSVVCYAALLHDIGKIGVSDGVLNKPGPLLPEERALVQSHVRIGHDLIKRVPALAGIADVVLHHHEWYDGSGYPDGLRGESISLASRIVSVVDTYCAMITKRSYKDACTDQEARAELVRCSGSQFDPRIVETFLQVLDLPEAQEEMDEASECGVIPGFNQLQDYQEAAQ